MNDNKDHLNVNIIDVDLWKNSDVNTLFVVDLQEHRVWHRHLRPGLLQQHGLLWQHGGAMRDSRHHRGNYNISVSIYVWSYLVARCNNTNTW